jgi:membrane peptidoglycan carboxypeptidase
MNKDNWHSQQNGNVSPQQNGHASPPTRTGSLLRDYRQQQQEHSQHPPLTPQPSFQTMPSTPPSPPATSQQGWPAPQGWPSGQKLLAGTAQLVRRWSGRMAAVPRPVDQLPLVLYRPSAPPPQRLRKPWKRSRTLRIAMQMKHRRERLQQSGPGVRAIVSGILIALLILLLAAASSGSAYAYKYYQDQLPQLQGLANQQMSQTTRIYDRNWNLLYEVYDNRHAGGGRRTPVSYEYLPQVLKDAQTSAEDPTFWTNSGIDPQAMLRAGGQYLQAGGSVVSGASTMTQQLIKNMDHETAVTLSRKIPEAALAIGLTQQYPKTKIMEMYFNISPYGAQNLGVEAAVEDYFHLNPQCDKNFNCIPGVYYLSCNAAHQHQCNPAQCATSKYCDPLLGLVRASLLAGMPQDPPTYDPTFGFVNPSTGVKYYLERQQYVLNQMLKYQVVVPGLGLITPQLVGAAEAMTARMSFPPYRHVFYYGSQHFVQWVIQQMEEQLGITTFLNGGFNVRTTIDYKLEAYVEQAIRHHLNDYEYHTFLGTSIPLSTGYNIHNSAAVVMDAKNGEVLAMAGSANYKSQDPTIAGNYNSALAYRQPGSSFKPLVYATAFQQGWYPGIVLTDSKTKFPGGYHPTDYGGGFHNGPFSIRLGLSNSFNIPAVKALQFAGLDNVANTARRFGITALDTDVANYNALHNARESLDQQVGLSAALGTLEVPLIQMVGAYQVFANNGTRVPPKSVLDIWDNYGRHLYHYDPAHPHGVQVISPQISYMMTNILSDEPARAIEFTGDHELSMYDWNAMDGQNHAVAAKTGTTDSFKDNWTIGYTPDVVVGVWSGNANNTQFNQGVVGITGAAPIWHDVIEHVMGRCDAAFNKPCFNYGYHDSAFSQPQGVTNYCGLSKTNGLAGGTYCDWLLNSDIPQQTGTIAPAPPGPQASPTPATGQ